VSPDVYKVSRVLRKHHKAPLAEFDARLPAMRDFTAPESSLTAPR
jgi:hypothetical protein